jgi:hypothetical protein
VKTGIQDGKEKAGFLLEFIPKKIGAGMTTRRTRIGKVDFKSTICLRTPRLQGEGSLVYPVRNNAPLLPPGQSLRLETERPSGPAALRGKLLTFLIF